MQPATSCCNYLEKDKHVAMVVWCYSFPVITKVGKEHSLTLHSTRGQFILLKWDGLKSQPGGSFNQKHIHLFGGIC